MKAHQPFMFVAIVCCASLAQLTACTVDEFSNMQRTDDCKKCEAEGGTCFIKFCLMGTKSDAGPRDAGPKDAGPVDASDRNPDTGSAAPDDACSEEGKVEVCYDGDAKTSVQLPCHSGTHTCSGGKWGECEKEVTPQPEICNGEDDDCDGLADNLPDGSASESCTIDSAQGLCAAGTRTCGAQGSSCMQSIYPAASDICDGRDEDCDGKTDEATDKPCYDDAADGCKQDAQTGKYTCTGSCRAGKLACENGQYASECAGSVTPVAEVCTQGNGPRLDEDCDGTIDENCACVSGTSCYDGSPADTQNNLPCHAGMLSCSDKMHGTCTGQVLPNVEDCANEGSDDDCNGVKDDLPIRGTSCAAESDAKGACKTGATWQCQDKKQVCVPAAMGVEVCDGNHVDEDCDGTADEGFSTESDANNCGACGVKCSTGLGCCSGKCVNTTSSNVHCGSCTMGCATGSACCNSKCSDLQEDNDNCGTCGNSCTLLGLTGCGKGSCKLLN